MPEDRPIITGAIGAEADKRDTGHTRPIGSLGGAKPKWPRYELPIPQTLGHRKLPPGAGTQPKESVTNRFSFEMPTLTYPGPGRQPPGAGTRPVTAVTDWYTFGMPTPTYPGPARQPLGTGIQPATDRFAYELPPRTRTRLGLDWLWDDGPDTPNSVCGNDKLLPRTEVPDFDRSPEADVMATVAHLQLEVEALKFGQLSPPALAKKTLNRWHLHPPKCINSVGELVRISIAIIRSNGWDDATVALQLLSHLEGDALNVALIVPEVKSATRAGLVGALTEHYGSPGHLADYHRQFEIRHRSRDTCG